MEINLKNMKQKNTENADKSGKLFLQILKDHNLFYSKKDFVHALVLLTMLKNKVDILDSDALYEDMLALANQYAILSPFSSKQVFFDTIKFVKNNISWKLVFNEYTLGDGMPISTVPDFVVDHFKGEAVEAKKIFIPFAEIFADKLIDLVESNPNATYTIGAIREVADIYRIIFKFNTNVNVIDMNIYDPIDYKDRYDYICMVPPLGIRITQEESRKNICRDLALSQMEDCLRLLDDNGSLLITTTSKIGFAGGSIEYFRKYINDNYNVKALSELPMGIFENTAVKTYLLNVTRKPVVDVTINIYGKGGLSKNDKSVVLLHELKLNSNEFKNRTDWVVERIIHKKDAILDGFMSKFDKVVKLQEVCEVFRGKVVKKNKDSDLANGNVGFVNISNITAWDLDCTNLEKIEIDEDRKIRNYILEDGDLLLASRGTIVKCAIFREQAIKCIASPNITIIRPKTKVLSSEYLKVFFDSTPGRIALDALKQGDIVVAISYQELKNLKVPIPPMDEQKKIEMKFREELNAYKETKRQAETRWANAQTEIFEML